MESSQLPSVKWELGVEYTQKGAVLKCLGIASKHSVTLRENRVLTRDTRYIILHLVSRS